ncbi:MAG TPA: HD domain-containing protein [Saprospiraceae bacterium]|nr:HD domain-containing protein [Saprospiraceae bacterium]
MNKMKLINDPVYGLIHIRTPLIFDIIEHPLFQRLRRIKQTGLTHLVYPGAQHTRFHHALGAMHLMGMAIDELRIKQTDISKVEEEAALIAVLLHDIGHSPYSHALERLILEEDHEEIGKVIIAHLAADLGDQLLLALDMFTGMYHRPFFHQLISGQLDLDRLDYLSRDSFYTGVAEGVVGHDRILRMLRVMDDELVVEEKGIYSIEKFLVARHIMYWQVYLHKTVLAAELMAQAIIKTLKQLSPEERKGYVTAELAYFLDQKITLQHFTSNDAVTWFHFQNLDDVSVDYSIKQLQYHQHDVLKFLTTHLIQRSLHKVIWSDTPMPEKSIQQIREQCMAFYHWTPDMVDQLIWTGTESNTMYLKEDPEIQILAKSGEIKPLSSFVQQPLQLGASKKYYVCHPKMNFRS